MPGYRPVLDRFLEKIRTDPVTGCWEWQARRHRGYGTFWLKGSRFAHRVSWELLVGPIPEGLTIDHLCRNKGCVRPDHLEPVPATLNTSRSHEFRARRTHCDKGHEFTPENTGWITPRDSYPYRYCRQCSRKRVNRWRQKNRVSA
jgi:hypothetical protein